MYPSYYPQQQQQMRMATPSQYGLKGRPVSSLEEARATSIDFDGSVFFFPDLANRRIYTKQINMDGTATLNMYELKDFPIVPSPQASFVTREEFEEAINKLQASISKPTPPEAEAPAYLF